MAVRLRFAMHGPRHNRIFHIVAIEQSMRRNAKPIETLGVFDPHLRPGETTKRIEWSVDRIKYWLGVGAQPSKTLQKLFDLGNITPNLKHSKPHLSSTEPDVGSLKAPRGDS